MALYAPALYKAIHARLTGDATLAGFLGNSTASVRAQFPNDAVDPSGTTFPLVTFYIASEEVANEGLDTRIIDYMVEFHLYVEAQPAAGGDSLLVLEKIKERIMGDWPEQATKAPSYGLDRWLPDFSAQTGDAATAYSAMVMEFRNGRDGTDFDGGGIREWIMNFSAHQVKTKP